ncbi:MAG: thioredoxin family protein [Burkholderiales bacterium]|nr:thioredoxin family protein [Burkholderiales bacterium]
MSSLSALCKKISGILLTAGIVTSVPGHATEITADYGLAPEFQQVQGWMNSPPLNMAHLRGKVVLIDFWTYTCINCLHTLPYVKQWHDRYRQQGLVVIGVHTPEFPEEKDTANLQAAIQRLDVRFPVAQDNDYATWNAYRNRYWPALYLINQQGHIVYQHFGEGNYAQTESMIEQLLSRNPKSH